MSSRLRLAVLAALAALPAASCSCGAKIRASDSVSITFDAPVDNADLVLNPSGKAYYIVEANDPSGLTTLVLQISGWDTSANQPATPQVITSCDAKSGTDVKCTTDFDPGNYHPDPSGYLAFIAIATDLQGIPTTATIHAKLSGPAVHIVSPQATPGVTPAAALVRGPVALSATVVDNLPIVKVDFLLDDKQPPLATVTGSGNGTSYTTTSNVNLQAHGLGRHKLTALATDKAGQTGKDVLNINVFCGADTDCTTGKRCCTDDGQCHAEVAAYGTCDCTHPCQDGQGCLTGTCGQTPAQCRNGCDPGAPDRPADDSKCGPNHYCLPLPPSEVTAANQGGACAQGDNCDVFAQNCPGYPLDRSKPVDPQANPTFPSTCHPAGQNANVCYPSGPKGQGVTCGGDFCTTDKSALLAYCAQGLICVTPIDSTTHQPVGDSTCQPYCHYDNNGGPIQNGCDSSNGGCCPGGMICEQLLGAGYVPLPIGACGSLL